MRCDSPLKQRRFLPSAIYFLASTAWVDVPLSCGYWHRPAKCLLLSFLRHNSAEAHPETGEILRGLLVSGIYLKTNFYMKCPTRLRQLKTNFYMKCPARLRRLKTNFYMKCLARMRQLKTNIYMKCLTRMMQLKTNIYMKCPVHDRGSCTWTSGVMACLDRQNCTLNNCINLFFLGRAVAANKSTRKRMLA